MRVAYGLCALLLLSVGCAKPVTPRRPAPQGIFVTAPVLASIARAMTGEEISTTWRADTDPRVDPPDRETMARMQNARLVIMQGYGYERWSATAELPEHRTVRTGERAVETPMRVVGSTHQHGMEGARTNDEIDPYLWVDPALALEQVRAVAAALDVDVPAALADSITGLEARYAALESATLRAGPGAGYLARSYGWAVSETEGVVLEVDGGLLDILRTNAERLGAGE